MTTATGRARKITGNRVQKAQEKNTAWIGRSNPSNFSTEYNFAYMDPLLASFTAKLDSLEGSSTWSYENGPLRAKSKGLRVAYEKPSEQFLTVKLVEHVPMLEQLAVHGLIVKHLCLYEKSVINYTSESNPPQNKTLRARSFIDRNDALVFLHDSYDKPVLAECKNWSAATAFGGQTNSSLFVPSEKLATYVVDSWHEQQAEFAELLRVFGDSILDLDYVVSPPKIKDINSAKELILISMKYLIGTVAGSLPMNYSQGYPITHQGIFTDSFAKAIRHRIPVREMDAHRFLDLLAQEIKPIANIRSFGTDEGIIGCANDGELEICKAEEVPTNRNPRGDSKTWAKARLVKDIVLKTPS